MSSPDEIDHEPLRFGKYSGQTPNEISEKDPQYIVWMYDTITNKDTCSKLLRDECAKVPKKPYSKSVTPKEREQFGETYNRAPPKVADSFDDFEDSIPF